MVLRLIQNLSVNRILPGGSQLNHHLWSNSISPFVRTGRIMKSYSLTGEWMDHDHVYTYIEQGEAELADHNYRQNDDGRLLDY